MIGEIFLAPFAVLLSVAVPLCLYQIYQKNVAHQRTWIKITFKLTVALVWVLLYWWFVLSKS